VYKGQIKISSSFSLVLDVKLTENLFPGLLDGIVIDFHLLGEILFEPFVFFNIVIDELDSQLTVNLNGSFT